ncbi:MAG TPA: ATP-binding protein, partial [Planctomycetota bacterium]|nr:ATP-binding protein [Planctomycetota bacterium]
PERIARLRAAADVVLYTPGSEAGVPLGVLRSLAAPQAAVLAEPEALRDRVEASVSALLALVGVDADPVRSREHIVLSLLVERAWRAGRDLDLAGLIGALQQPGIDKIGVMDLETFYPAKERFGLAMRLNALLASPSFAAWLAGTPLDAASLLFGPSGRPRVSIVSIAHLSDRERMFVVTALLGEVLAWVRSQPGTSSLRAILYMDEVFGYLPPTAEPPSKRPLLTLLKQARAFGLGVVLVTQNPVDLDYKALANAGTWFIGRLQTERDRSRLLDGLAGAGSLPADRAALEAQLAGLENRVFLLHDVHDDAPVLFQSRWALSYLRGPLSLGEIRVLRPSGSQPAATSPPAAPSVPPPAKPADPA